MTLSPSFPGWKFFMALTFLVASLFAARAQAVSVDTELVVLVDAQASPSSNFGLILEGVAQAFEQQTFIDSVTNGPFGSIAATVVLFNSGSGEAIGIPWMELSSSSDLQNFATSVRNITNPNIGGNVNYASAIATGAAQIASTAFEGTLRQLTVVDDGTGFFAANPSATQSARDAALASSVDVINAVVFDAAFRENAVSNFYNDNIVGGGGALELVANPERQNNAPEVTAAIEVAITETVSQPTIDSNALNSVPEPSVSLLSGLAAFALLIRRRR